MAEALLRVEALDAAYDAVQVVWGLDLQVQAGTVTSLIGSNGAGKTTTMNVIAGTLPARRGEIIFRGEDITDRKSTRLNSSHSQISYAVFCLKKKKNTKHTRLAV